MFFASQRDNLRYAQTEAQSLLKAGYDKPRVFSTRHFSTFSSQLHYSVTLIAEEKEIIFFAILQWIAMIVAYLLWIQILDWIPDDLWEEVRQSRERDDKGTFMLINLLLTGWSLLIITAVSFPLSLLSAAMVAAHYLRYSQQVSTIDRCFQLASRNLGKLWVFTAIDAWITVDAIMDRLPRKHGNRTAAEELLYYAWKIGTVGVLPALVAGKGYLEAAKDSLILLKNQPARTIGIRMGYSLLCWIVGITAYIGALYYFIRFGDPANHPNMIYNFYFLMVVPLLIAIGITTVFLRPFFLVMTARLYTDNIAFAAPDLSAEQADNGILGFIFALILCIILGAIIGVSLFEHQLGIKEWIESLAAQDIEEYRRKHR